jgi:hypothetical protein
MKNMILQSVIQSIQSSINLHCFALLFLPWPLPLCAPGIDGLEKVAQTSTWNLSSCRFAMICLDRNLQFSPLNS